MIQCSKHLEEMAGNNGTEQRLDNGFGSFVTLVRAKIKQDFRYHLILRNMEQGS